MHIDYKGRDRHDDRQKQERKLFKNYEIFQGKVRLIEDGKQPVVIERDEAIEIARSRGMDLVQIAYNKNDFPHAVTKILDYSKHMYEKKKKEKLAKKQARANEVNVKEICFSIRIDDGDMKTKVAHIREFLEAGDKVKIIVKLLRREMHLKSFATDTMKTVLSKIDDIAELDAAPNATGNILTCVVRKKK